MYDLEQINEPNDDRSYDFFDDADSAYEEVRCEESEVQDAK